MPFLFDSTYVLVIPALVLAIWAQYKVRSTYAKYSQVSVRTGITGAEVAQRILADANVMVDDGRGRRPMQVSAIPGELTDHYDPRARELRLSEGVYYGSSIAALGVAAHEAGHALQHAHGYAPMALRSVMYPMSSLGSSLAIPLFILGLIIPAFHSLMLVGIGLFSLAVAFTVITLPVEFNASRRALAVLAEGRYLDSEELAGARKVLQAAALTYVAAALMAVLQLLRMLILARGRD